MSKIIQLNKKKKPICIAAIIQARMTSSRFPGKSMALLNGKPVLQHVIESCKKISPINRVIVAVPDTDDSEPILELADWLKVDNFCGSELNVLNRYYEAAKLFNVDIILRITADCPMINPIVCSEILSLLIWKKLDYCSNIHPIRTYPQGLDCEVFTFDCLEAAHTLSDPLKPGDWEHVTPWMQRTKELKKANVTQKNDASEVNLCIDFPEDIERVTKICLKVETNDN